MKALLTSCGRYDLLKETVESLDRTEIHLTIHEDGKCDYLEKIYPLCDKLFYAEKNIGQHKSIERYLNSESDKYYLHLEDDWKFNNTYDWIKASKDIMEADPTIIKVLCNSDSPHPCSYDTTLADSSLRYFGKYGEAIYQTPVKKIISDAKHFDTNGNGLKTCDNFGYLQPWTNNNIIWHGFSFNPGVTRLDLLKQFVPFGRHEQDVAKAIYDAGYKVVRLENGVCHHIGQGRSTHD